MSGANYCVDRFRLQQISDAKFQSSDSTLNGHNYRKHSIGIIILALIRLGLVLSAICLAILMIVYLKRRGQLFLLLYRYTDSRLAKPVCSLGVCKQGAANDHTKCLHIACLKLCVENNDHCVQASFCVWYLQAAASFFSLIQCNMILALSDLAQYLSLRTSIFYLINAKTFFENT